jgi:hypothetical protein
MENKNQPTRGAKGTVKLFVLVLQKIVFLEVDTWECICDFILQNDVSELENGFPFLYLP